MAKSRSGFSLFLSIGLIAALSSCFLVPSASALSLAEQDIVSRFKNHYAYPFVKEFVRQKIRQAGGLQSLFPAKALDLATSGNGIKDNAVPYHSKAENSKPTPEMIVEAGYPVEIHSVTTEDGYILQMHRIPYGVAPGSGPNEGSKTPIYVQHCLLCSSADWIVTGPGEALGYLLADAGYDVWLGNIRGNTYSKKHVSLTEDDAAFWEYSWDEHGYYDVPAQMDLISAVTGKQDMFYIGHSMGTTMFFVMQNVRPEYRDRIKAMFALAPIARVDHMLSPIGIIAPFVDEVEWLLDMFGLDEFLPSDAGLDLIASLFCNADDWAQPVCSNILFLLCGFDEAQLPQDLLPVILGHTPAGTSTRTIVHYAQLVNAGRWQHFDHGPEMNLEIYGQEEPPEYDRKMITSPVLTYWSDNDWLGQPQDVAWLVNGLPNLVQDYRVPFDLFNHMDFLWGIDAPELLYADVLARLNELNSQD